MHLRPRERLQSGGPEKLTDEELLSIVLGHGNSQVDVVTISKSVIQRLKTLESWPTFDQIAAIPGIGPAKCCQIMAILALNRRNLLPRIRNSLKKPDDALPYLNAIRFSRQEKFAVITLDGHHQAIDTHIVTIGLANQSQIHPRETFNPAIRDHAVSILIAHNHPSGFLQPSQADLNATRKLHQAAQIVGIPILDHLIVGETGFYSIRENHPEYFQAGAFAANERNQVQGS